MFEVGGPDVEVGGGAGAVLLAAGAGGGCEDGEVAEGGEVAAAVEGVVFVGAGFVEVSEAGEFDDGVGVDVDGQADGEFLAGAEGSEVG